MLRKILCATVAFAILAPAGVVGADSQHNPPPPLTIESLVYVFTSDPNHRQERVDFIAYAQVDPRWRNMRLGSGTIGQQGCLISVYSMAATASGTPMNPAQVTRAFRKEGLIRGSGRVSLAIDKALPISIADRYFPDHASRSHVARRTREEMRDGSFVALKLDKRRDKKNIQEHWVFVKKVVGTDDFLVLDPGSHNQETLLRERYPRARIVEVRILQPTTSFG